MPPILVSPLPLYASILPIASSYPCVPSVTYPRHTVCPILASPVSPLCHIPAIQSPILVSHSSPYLGADRVTGRSRTVLLVRTQKTGILSENGPKSWRPHTQLTASICPSSNFNACIEPSNIAGKIDNIVAITSKLVVIALFK